MALSLVTEVDKEIENQRAIVFGNVPSLVAKDIESAVIIFVHVVH